VREGVYVVIIRLLVVIMRLRWKLGSNCGVVSGIVSASLPVKFREKED
jgi:hypothetical protein